MFVGHRVVPFRDDAIIERVVRVDAARIAVVFAFNCDSAPLRPPRGRACAGAGARYRAEGGEVGPAAHRGGDRPDAAISDRGRLRRRRFLHDGVLENAPLGLVLSTMMLIRRLTGL